MLHRTTTSLLLLLPGLLLASPEARADCSGMGTTGAFPITLTDALHVARLDSNCLIELSQADCTVTSPIAVGFTFQLPSGTAANSTQDIFLSTDGTCQRTPSSGSGSAAATFDLPHGMDPITPVAGTTDEVEYNASNGFTVDQIVKFAAAASTATSGSVTLPSSCPQSPVRAPVYLCVAVTNGSSTLTASQEFLVSTTPPPAAQLVTVTPLDGGLDVSWTMPTSAALPLNFQVIATGSAGDMHKSALLQGVTTSMNDVKLMGLTNGASYSVMVATLDNSGVMTDYSDANVQDSTPVSGTPAASSNQSGSFAGSSTQDGTPPAATGCASTDVAALALLGLALPLLRRRART